MRSKIRKIVFISGFAILLIISIAFVLVLRLRSTFDDKNIISQLNSKNVFPNTKFIPLENYEVHTKFIGNLANPKVLLIHGSPGYWSDFKHIFADSLLRKNYCLISFDRPGYGKTSIPARESLSEQAKVAATVMNYFGKEETFIVLGHSFGGAVLQQCILDYPEKIKHAIYVAPCLSPEYQKAKWYNLIVAGGVPNKLMPHELRSSNLEMMALSKCLYNNEPKLPGISTPTTYIQGKKDILVPYKTQEYYLQHHKNVDYLLLDDLNHFVPWSRPGLIIETINRVGSMNKTSSNL